MHSSATLWACFVMETSQKVQLRIVFKLGATLAPVCFVKGKTLKRFKMNQTFCGAKEKTPNNENCLLFCYISQCVAKTILEKKKSVAKRRKQYFSSKHDSLVIIRHFKQKSQFNNSRKNRKTNRWTFIIIEDCKTVIFLCERAQDGRRKVGV